MVASTGNQLEGVVPTVRPAVPSDRDAVLGDSTIASVGLHLGVLTAYSVAGLAACRVTFARRLAR